jgi:hypothetical protein
MTMGITPTALGLKFLATWVVLLVTGLVTGPSPWEGVVISAVVAVVSWMADRLIDFRFQGLTRWAIDGGLAAFTIYLAQFLWPGVGISFPVSLFAGFVVGSIEIPLHFYLASRFGLQKRGNNGWGGIE